MTLIYGKDEQAIEAANLLKEHLDVTVLIKPPGDVSPPRVTEFPVVKGTIRQAKGHLGAFELTVDDYAAPTPSSRGELAFGPARNGAMSRCDIVLDLSGGAPLFPAADLRDGYLRADPGDPAAVLRAVLKARDLIGTFDKPRYITFHRGSVRAFALQDRRLPPLPRSLSRPARSRRPAIMWRSMRRSAPAAANAPPPARPAPPPMRCRRPTR